MKNTTWVSSGLIEDMDGDGDVDLKDIAISLAFLGGMIAAVLIKVLRTQLYVRLTRNSSTDNNNSD